MTYEERKAAILAIRNAPQDHQARDLALLTAEVVNEGFEAMRLFISSFGPPVPPPVGTTLAVADSFTGGIVDEETEITAAQLFLNDTNPNALTLEILSVGSAVGCTLNFGYPSASVGVTPTAAGTATFEYTMRDSLGFVSIASVALAATISDIAISLDLTGDVLPSTVTFSRASAGTSIGADRLIALAAVDAPRFHHNHRTGVSRGLLLEGERTNQIDNSQLLAGTGTDTDPQGWSNIVTGTRVPIASIFGTADGARAYDFDAVSTRPYLQNSTAQTALDVVSLSCWIEENGYSSGDNNVIVSTNGTPAFELEYVSLPGTTPWSPEDAYCQVTVTTTANSLIRWGLGGNGATTGSAIVSRPQAEVGAFPSSYIPTAPGLTATRSADRATINLTTLGADGSERAGVVQFRTCPYAVGADQVIYQEDDGTVNERFTILRNTSDEIRVVVVDGGVEVANQNLGTVAVATDARISWSLSLNDLRSVLDAGVMQTDTSVTLPTVTTGRLGHGLSGNDLWSTLAELTRTRSIKTDEELGGSTPPVQVIPKTWYGMRQADSLSNQRLGWGDTFRISYRFRAVKTGNIVSARWWRKVGNLDGGYGLGTGGNGKLSIQANLATGGNIANIPDGVDIGTTSTFTGTSGGDEAGYLSGFSGAGCPVVVGQVYHLVFENTHPQQGTNYFSCNGLATFYNPNPRNPFEADLDWAFLRRQGTNPLAGWSQTQGRGPVLDLGYSDGTHQGGGVMQHGHVSSDDYNGWIDDTNMVRQVFTPAENMTVTAVGIRVGKMTGSGVLSIRLEDNSGVEIETVTIPNASIPQEPAGPEGNEDATNDKRDAQRQVQATFATPRVLASGTTYRVRFSCASGTRFRTCAHRDGTAAGYGYHTSLNINGRAETSSNSGSTWTGYRQDNSSNRSDYDLQFYFLRSA